jgi:hypothetical protein
MIKNAYKVHLQNQALKSTTIFFYFNQNFLFIFKTKAKLFYHIVKEQETTKFQLDRQLDKRRDGKVKRKQNVRNKGRKIKNSSVL